MSFETNYETNVSSFFIFILSFLTFCMESFILNKRNSFQFVSHKKSWKKMITFPQDSNFNCVNLTQTCRKPTLTNSVGFMHIYIFNLSGNTRRI